MTSLEEDALLPLKLDWFWIDPPGLTHCVWTAGTGPPGLEPWMGPLGLPGPARSCASLKLESSSPGQVSDWSEA
jgi:hypothetical protein